MAAASANATFSRMEALTVAVSANGIAIHPSPRCQKACTRGVSRYHLDLYQQWTDRRRSAAVNTKFNYREVLAVNTNVGLFQTK